ncbi:MAG TPA: hypothetical protein VLZ74_10080 [Methylocella sp.]|nr:hypothetical protein [Methylocella sp.]
MGSHRQGSVAWRVAFSAFALYALLLQAFLAASAPAHASDFPGGVSAVNCSVGGYGSGTPGGDPVPHHGLCCILGCAAAACAYVAIPSPASAFPERVASPVVYARTPVFAGRTPLKHYFAARGPPAFI